MCLSRFIALSIRLLDNVNKACYTDASVFESFGDLQDYDLIPS